MTDGFLHRYFLNHGNRSVHKWTHYFDIYERHLERFRSKNPVVVEIGVATGGSLQMWKAYFGEGARIVGIDINPDCRRHEEDGIEIFIGEQANPEFLESVLEKYPRIDIVIDDGSHVMKDMIASFEHLYDRVSPDGVYLVEDTHTCYWDSYGGGLKRPGSFMEFVKDRLDDINAPHCADLPDSRFSRSTASINVYDSVVVFEKRPQGRRLSIQTGAVEEDMVQPSTVPQIPEVRLPPDRTEIDSALRRIDELEAANSALLRSTSWKVTAPLRAMRRLFARS